MIECLRSKGGNVSQLIEWLFVLSCAAGIAFGQGAPAVVYASGQTETDEYTRYELLSPETASFAIRYAVTATRAGVTYYFDPIRKSSVASGESVIDAMTGQALRLEVVSGVPAGRDLPRELMRLRYHIRKNLLFRFRVCRASAYNSIQGVCYVHVTWPDAWIYRNAPHLLCCKSAIRQICSRMRAASRIAHRYARAT